MASSSRKTQNKGQLTRNVRRSSGTREYGEVPYGTKRKAPQGLNLGLVDSKRVTRSRDKKNNISNNSIAEHKQNERLPSKIPIPRSGLDQSSSSPSLASPTQQNKKLIDVSTISEGSPIRSLLEEYGLNSEEAPLSMDIVILQTLASMNKRLKNLDKLEEMNCTLKGEFTRVQNQVGEVSNQVTTVKADLKRCEDKWEAGSDNMLERISKVEEGLQAFELKWDSSVSDSSDNLSALQNNIDSNSSRVANLEAKLPNVDSNSAKIAHLEAELSKYKEKLDSLNSLKGEIKEAAEGKFQEVQDSIKCELKKEIVKEVRTIKASTDNEIKYDKLKNRAYNKRHNLIIFGLAENDSLEADRQAAVTFFSERMNLSHLSLEALYRLGSVGNRPRPLVIKFPNIVDRWAIWNRKNKIKYVEGQPIWIQQDLPKPLREDLRILQRVAKVARAIPERFSDIKIKDYKIFINGTWYGRDDLHHLPLELSPETIYSPRSEEALAFFTKQSPFSNHFHSPFFVDGIQFGCIEQYLAVQKARLANDKDYPTDYPSFSSTPFPSDWVRPPETIFGGQVCPLKAQTSLTSLSGIQKEIFSAAPS